MSLPDWGDEILPSSYRVKEQEADFSFTSRHHPPYSTNIPILHSDFDDYSLPSDTNSLLQHIKESFDKSQKSFERRTNASRPQQKINTSVHKSHNDRNKPKDIRALAQQNLEDFAADVDEDERYFEPVHRSEKLGEKAPEAGDPRLFTEEMKSILPSERVPSHQNPQNNSKEQENQNQHIFIQEQAKMQVQLMLHQEKLKAQSEALNQAQDLIQNQTSKLESVVQRDIEIKTWLQNFQEKLQLTAESLTQLEDYVNKETELDKQVRFFFNRLIVFLWSCW